MPYTVELEQGFYATKDAVYLVDAERRAWKLGTGDVVEIPLESLPVERDSFQPAGKLIDPEQALAWLELVEAKKRGG